MAGYIGKSQGVTQVDGYNRTEADDRYVNASGDTMTGNLSTTGNIKATNGFLAGANNTYLYEGASNILNIRIGETGPYAEFVDAGSNVLKIGNASGRLSLTSNGVERMHFDDYGCVTKPYQPIWGGRHSGGNLNDFVTMYNDASVTNGSGWVLSGVSNERLYPPVSGWYQITMTGLASPFVGTQGHTQVYLYKSNVSQYNACAGTTDYTRMVTHAYLYLTPTDWISFYTAGTAMHTDQAYNKVTCMLVA